MIATRDIAAIFTARDDSGYSVEALDTDGGRAPVIWDLSGGPLPLLIARSLEMALGLSERSAVKEEQLPAVSGRLPDLERLLRPLHREPGAPAVFEADRGAVPTEEDAPQGVKVLRTGDHVSYRVPASSVGAWPLYLAVPCSLWLVKNHTQLVQQELPWPIFDGLALAGMALCCYSVAAMVINGTRLELSSTSLRARRFPLPWPGTGRLPRELISHLETESHLMGKGSWTYSLHVILRDGRRMTLLKQAPRAMVEWFEDALGAELAP